MCVTTHQLSNCGEMYCDEEIIDFFTHAVFSSSETFNNNMFVNEFNIFGGHHNISSCKDLEMLVIVGLRVKIVWCPL